ncbi:MAG: hypothetical protein RR294_00320 [Bacilli bacterium]
MNNQEFLETKLKEKSILKIDEKNKIRNEIKSKEYTKNEIEDLIEESIKNHIYIENKKNEYNQNKNIEIKIIEKSKKNIKVEVDNNVGYLKTHKSLTLNDLEIALMKIGKLLELNVVDIKRIKYENKNYILLTSNEKECKTIDKIIQMDKEKNTKDIIEVIEIPLSIENSKIIKSEYIKMILFNILIDNNNIGLNTYGISDGNNFKLFPITNFLNTEKIKGLNENDIYLNNCICDKYSLLDCLFKNYYEEIGKFINRNFDDKKLKKIEEIFDLELEQKEVKIYKTKIENNFNLIKKYNNKKILEIFRSYSIIDEESLLKYMSNNIEYGTTVEIDSDTYKIPFGALESIEGRNNKKITYDNPEIIAFLNKYYSKHKNEINPTQIEVTQLLKSISTTNFILNKIYSQNYPLDIFNSEVASSNEQIEFEACFLEANNIKVKRFVICIEINSDNKTVITDPHFFLVYLKNDKFYYFENALTDFKGIYEFDTLEHLIDKVISKIIYSKELNPYKNISEFNSKYVLYEIDKILPFKTLEYITKSFKKAKKYNIKNALYLYQCENEIRKNILENIINVYSLKDKEIILKPSDKINDENEYKVEFIKILSENIMNLIYKSINNNEEYFVIGYNGEKENINKGKTIENKLSENTNKQETRKFSTVKVIILLIILILVLFSLKFML